MRARKYCDAHTRAWQGSARAGATRSRADKQLRAQVLAEEPTCRDCGAPATEAGHIVSFARGGAYVRDNLKGQCRSCNLNQMFADRGVGGEHPRS
nr:HNH endonuclease signature motif containing protein [Blastococcus sp. CT_GayMR19]